MKLTVGEISQAVSRHAHDAHDGGDVPLTPVVTGMSWDSRTVKPGDLYVALPGERVDGHDFAAAAVEAGAAAVLASREVNVNAPVIMVEDAQRALSDLARAWRGRLKGTVVGLSGSTGKTTTKGLVRDVLAAAGSVVATKANQNNEIGVPATLLAAEADTDFVVVEMGMRGLGQIEELCGIAHPDWGLVTNVGESHIELLGSRDNIARAKSELLAALPEGGIAFVNAADDFASRVREYAGLDARGVRTVLFDGSGDNAMAASAAPHPAVWASGIVLDAEGRPSFTMHAARFGEIGRSDADGSHPCVLELRGVHNVSNACSAAAVGLAAGLSLAQCCAVLAQAQPERGRQRIVAAPSGVTVVDDAYNANPDSMRASLATFAALNVPGRHIAVLGDMGELGAFARECHERVGAIAGQSGLDLLVCVGPLSERIALSAVDAGMPERSVRHVMSVDSALVELKSLVAPGDAVLVKASHFMQFDRIVEGLVG